MKYLTLTQSANYLGVTRQAIHILLKTKRLPISIIDDHIKIHSDELDKYYESRWSRNKYFTKEEVGVREGSKYIGITEPKLYYLIYYKKIPFRRVGALYILKKKDLEEWKQNTMRYRSRSKVKAIKSSTGQENIKERKRFKKQFTTLPKAPE